MEGKVFMKLDTFAMLLPLPTTKHSFVFIMQYACLIESPSVPNKQIPHNNLIDKRHGSRILKETASRPNHISYRKVYINEFVQNSLHCNMGMIIFDLGGYGGC